MSESPDQNPSPPVSDGGGLGAAARRAVKRIPEPLRSRLRGAWRGAPPLPAVGPHPAPPATATNLGDDRLTEADIHAAYRLFQGREPDPAGLAFFRPRIGKWSVLDVLPYFAHSEEFRNGETFRLIMGGTGTEAIEVVDLDGIEMVVPTDDPAVGAHVAAGTTYEPHVDAAVRRLLPPEGVFVDAGANLGVFSLLGARLVGPAGRVVSVEALASNAAFLRVSAALNGFTNITVHTAALADRPGTMVMDTAAGSNGILSGRLEDVLTDHDPTEIVTRELVSIVRLDDLTVAMERLDLLKIDIEGAEALAFAGAERTLEELQPEILLEYSPGLLQRVSGLDGAELLGDLIERGYRVGVLEDGSPPTRFLDDPAEIDAILAVTGGDHLDLQLTASPAD